MVLVVKSPVYFVIGLAPLKWKICRPPMPPTASNLPEGAILSAFTYVRDVVGMFLPLLVVVRVPLVSSDDPCLASQPNPWSGRQTPPHPRQTGAICWLGEAAQ